MSLKGYCGASSSAPSAPKTCVKSSAKRSSGARTRRPTFANWLSHGRPCERVVCLGQYNRRVALLASVAGFFFSASAPEWRERLHAKFARLTAQEEKHGLLEDPSGIGTTDGWARRLAVRGFALKGHRLVRNNGQPQGQTGG